MELKEIIAKRRSIRAYESKLVPEESLKNVLEAARLAPSARNNQSWKFVVVREEKRRQELARAADREFVAEAPVVIAAVATEPEYIMACEIPSYAVDLSIAVTHMILAAVDEGLGTCWLGAFSQQRVKEILKIPGKYRVVALLTLGFPRGEMKVKTRKSLEEIVCYETLTD